MSYTFIVYTYGRCQLLLPYDLSVVYMRSLSELIVYAENGGIFFGLAVRNKYYEISFAQARPIFCFAMPSPTRPSPVLKFVFIDPARPGPK